MTKRRREEDPIENVCRAWGQQRRRQLGWGEFGLGTIYEPHELLGGLQSVLGKLREDRNAAGSRSGKVVQVWPEVYYGEVLLVHRAWHAMDRRWREAFDVHFTLPYESGMFFRGLTARAKAAAIGLPVPTYWQHIAHGKAFVAGFLAQNDPDPSEVEYSTGTQ